MPDEQTGRLSVPVTDGAMMPAIVRRVDDAGIEVAELNLRLPSLDDVFLALTGHTTRRTRHDHRSGPRRLGLALRQCLTLSWRGIVKIRRNPLVLADVIFGPLIFLVLFVYVFGGAIAGSTEEYLQFALPGILGLMTLLATMGVGVALNQDVQKGVFDRFRSLPTLRIAPLVGAIGGDVVRQVVAIVALIGFGLLLGFRFGDRFLVGASPRARSRWRSRWRCPGCGCCSASR